MYNLDIDIKREIPGHMIKIHEFDIFIEDWFK